MKLMVNKDGTIQANATIAGQYYEVSETKRGSSSSIWSARDTIINRTTGRKTEKTRLEWFKFWKDYFEKQAEREKINKKNGFRKVK